MSNLDSRLLIAFGVSYWHCHDNDQSCANESQGHHYGIILQISNNIHFLDLGCFPCINLKKKKKKTSRSIFDLKFTDVTFSDMPVNTVRYNFICQSVFLMCCRPKATLVILPGVKSTVICSSPSRLSTERPITLPAVNLRLPFLFFSLFHKTILKCSE